MKYFRFVWKNVFRKKSRAFLTIASIVLVLILMVILTALLEAMEGTTGTGKGATHIVVQHATGLTNFMPLAYRQDRKSTRLNSSHLVISYAVFCLKKKKNNHHLHARFIDLYLARATAVTRLSRAQ